jgi:hypothetical protein
MPPAEALERAKAAARVWQVRWRRHSAARSVQRNAQAADIREAILTARTAVWRAEEDTWRLEGGRDLDGDNLTVVVAIEGNEVRLITEF